MTRIEVVGGAAAAPVPNWALVGGAAAVIGIDIGNTNHTLALVSLEGVPLEIVRGRTDREGGPDALVESLEQLVPDLLADATERGLKVNALGVGFGGPVDVAAGRVMRSHHVGGWEGFPLRQVLEEQFGLPVVLDNDANAGGLGEWRFGAGQDCHDLVYYNVGTGIGGAVILGGRLRHGASNLAGELGHTTVFPEGPACTCGQRGCLEAVSSGSAIEREMARLAIPYEGRKATAEDFFPLVSAGHSRAVALRDRIVEGLALSIRNVLHTLNPEMVVIGGGVARGGHLLFDPLQRRVEQLAMRGAVLACRILPARLGYEAGVIGAASLAIA